MTRGDYAGYDTGIALCKWTNRNRNSVM